MPENKTNLAILMDLLGVKPAEICAATGADKTLVSRWRSGKRRLMPDRHWADSIAACMLAADAKLASSAVDGILHMYYPAETLESEADRQSALAKWLAGAVRHGAVNPENRTSIYESLTGKIESLGSRRGAGESGVEIAIRNEGSAQENAVVYDIKGAQGSILMLLDMTLSLPEPRELIFVCPEGLDMYTRDTGFGDRLMDKLMEFFRAGHRLSVVLRTDFKMSDVSEFSGRWLVAHLLGYVKSYYYDDFRKLQIDKMLAVIEGWMGMRVAEGDFDGRHGIYTTIHFDRQTVDSIYEKCVHFRETSTHRFRYGMFAEPDGFLEGLEISTEQPSFQFTRLPHFCMTNSDEFQRAFSLSEDEMRLVEREFPPFLTSPADYGAKVPVRQIFCQDDIEEALLKTRHVSQELTAITSRRVCMTTQKLAEQLQRIRKMLMENKNYEVCFLPADVFDDRVMQICVWGDKAALGWVNGKLSAACKDYTNVGALHGYCATMWDRLSQTSARQTARKKLDMWLEKARRYGALSR